ncbi:histidine kinase [Nitrospirillum viridazoti]|uniref:histidine kinase n=2 Tax=Nitrospirillum TaxID=1543705 RepID=A0A560ISH9_9PROT|nr:histidine kinase [Nitrospirillum amazonense]TWB59530.1 two-component system sensor histidine kinase UhpB [Nitrospirillum amazonense]
MSLRIRLVLSIALLLLVSLATGGAAAWLRAERSVRTEMEAALSVGQHTVGSALAHLAGRPAPQDRSDEDITVMLTRLVGAFNGDRHLRVSLRQPGGGVVASSRLAVPDHPAPAWFVRSLDVPQLSAEVPLPGFSGQGLWLRLETDPSGEVSEVWGELGDDAVMMLLFSALALPMVYWTLGRALRSVDRLSKAFAQVAETGMETARPVAEAGPPELRRLAVSFNRMIERLAAAEARNRRLHEQLQTIQEEERADLARDLHDEVGPYLFAINVDVTALMAAAERAGDAAMRDQARSAREAVTHVQQEVKAILARLRPPGLSDLGLRAALENLAAFWRARRPDVAIAVTVAPGPHLGEAGDTAIYRVVQESLSNAIRHGRPRSVSIGVASSAGGITIDIADDGDGLPAGAPPSTGYGLRGMAERVAALGGSLTVANRPEGGVRVHAVLPSAAGISALATPEAA